MIKKILLYLSLLFITIFNPFLIKAQEENVTLHFFWANGCPHCTKEKIFLEKLTQKYPQLEIKDYEVTGKKENIEILRKIGKELSADVSGVPFTVIGEQYFSGYHNDDTTGKEIEEAILCAIENGCKDLLETTNQNLDHSNNQEKISLEQISVPILGKVNVKNLSLPFLTILIALIDGFNPCAMWVLLFLISLLLGMKDRKRMWILGTAFIISSAFVYFLFLSAWLNLFLFLGLIVWVRLIVGILAFGAGLYYLKDYFVNKNGGCKVMGDEKRQKIFEKLKNITQKKQLLIAIFGIILLAFAVNLVELICSAGLPAIYTQVLSLSNLPSYQYYLYLLLYILIFMLDDLFIFFTAMFTLQAVGIQSKYSRLSHLIGGLLMLLIGILMIFKPEILMFG